MRRWTWLPVAALASLLLALFLLFTGVALSQAAALALIVVTETLAGMVLWLAVRSRLPGPEVGMLELAGMGIALGTSLAAGSAMLLSPLFGGGMHGWALPCVVAALAWFWPGSRLHLTRVAPPRRAMGAVAGGALVLGLSGMVVNLRNYPLTWVGEWSGYHEDMIFFEALSTSLAKFGPHNSIFMVGSEIRYHWWAYGWAGITSSAAGAAPFVVVTRVLPVVALVGVVTLVVAWTAKTVSGWRPPLLAALLVVTGGYLGAINGTVLNFDSPSEAMSGMWLVALLVVFMTTWGERISFGLVAAAAFLGFTVTAGKISTGLVGFGALGLVALVLTLRRDPRARNLWVLLVASIAGAVVAYVVLISGTSTGGTLQLFSLASRAAQVQGLLLDLSPIGIAAGTASLILAVLARSAGVLWLGTRPASRWTPESILAWGLVLASVLPIIVLSEGVSETWFALAASVPLAVLSVVGLTMAWRELRNPRALWTSGLLSAAVFLVVAFLWGQGTDSYASARFWGPPLAVLLAITGGAMVAAVLGRSGARRAMWLGSTLTILVLATVPARLLPDVASRMPVITYLTGPVGNVFTKLYLPPGWDDIPSVSTSLDPIVLDNPRTAWSRAWVDAASELDSRTTPSDIVATNETTSFIVPALTRRLTYMTGAPYQWQYGLAGDVGSIPDRVRTSRAFVNDGDPAAFEDLCRAGATWLWASHDLTDRRDWKPYATVEFANDEVSLARLDRSRCP